MLACHQEAEGRRSSPEVHQEHVLNLLQDFQLPEHVANLVPFDALLLVHVLHGIHLLSVSLLHNAHLKYSKSGEKDVRFSKTFCILTAALLSCINRFQSHPLSDDRAPHKPSAGQGTVLPLQAPPQGRGLSQIPPLLFPLVLLPEAPLTPDDTPIIKVTIFK